MGNFKEFLLSEQIGLGNLGPSVDNLFNSQLLDSKIAGAFASTDVTGTEQPEGGHSLYLPSTDLTVPSTEHTGRITTLMLKRNPIYVRLSDGTEAHFTYDEYKRIEGSKPSLGKTMTIIFQRHPSDMSQMASKVEKVIVRD